jgi:hypothetical protein
VGEEDKSGTEKVTDKARERITLARGELWLLRISAGTGVISMLAHGWQFLHDIGLV